MSNYNQKYWNTQYYNEEIIKEWFKNYLTYLDGHFHELQNIQEIKLQFLKNEKREIETIINSKKEQEKIYNFVSNVINNI